jgi:poly(hydroxyalkanoate) depolymerase family esterase
MFMESMGTCAWITQRRHGGPHGALDYHLYVPSERDAGIQGVVLMLHGCTQGPEDFAAGTRMNAQAERHGLVVAYPAQTRGQNASLCWNWFRPDDQGRSGGEPALLADLVTSVAFDHGVPHVRVFAAGLSAGGAMAAILAQTHPEVFAAIGVHSGLAPGSASNVVSAFGARAGAGHISRPAPGRQDFRPIRASRSISRSVSSSIFSRRSAFILTRSTPSCRISAAEGMPGR